MNLRQWVSCHVYQVRAGCLPTCVICNHPWHHVALMIDEGEAIERRGMRLDEEISLPR